MKAKRTRINERRKKLRFPIHRDMRYKLYDNGQIVGQGRGETTDLSSGGIAFHIPGALPLGSYVELSVSWPVLLEDTCRMQLIAFGRLTRGGEGKYVSTIEKWEFRTQARETREVIPLRADSKLLRWVEYRREVAMKASMGATA